MIGGRARQAVQHDGAPDVGISGLRHGTARSRTDSHATKIKHSKLLKSRDPPRLGAFSIFTLKRSDISNLYLEAGTFFIADESFVL